ncbi:MAG TPA: TIGR02302 family protein [Hyphomicrobiales bacterium]|nr:TIGR02302 family protein [Hyphomicrobiales bacterium]
MATDRPTPRRRWQWPWPLGAGLDRLIARARAALLWEAAWPPLATAGAVALLFLALSWLGLWPHLPPWARIAGVVLFALGIAAALWPLRRLQTPSETAALARIDHASSSRHRPATTLVEKLASPGDDPVTRTLWRVHRERALKAAAALRAGAPAPGLRWRDPGALRFLVVLAAVVTFVGAGGDRLARIGDAFDWTTPAAPAVPPRLDAWVTPPGYTGQPPIFLAGQPGGTDADAGAAAQPEEEAVRTYRVPAGSVLVVRASAGEVAVEAGSGAAVAKADAAHPADTAGEKRFVLKADATVSARAGGGARRGWRFQVIPDKPPTIAFVGRPEPNARGTLTLTYRIDDDYGVVAAQADIRPVAAPGKSARPLYGPPEGRLPVERGRNRQLTATLDLASHPWAGAKVRMQLVARDEAGQEGRSRPIELTLPQRPFTQPVARALVEQRRNLALDANQVPRIMTALGALALYPEEFTPDLGVYLGLRSAYYQLDNARGDGDLRATADYLWAMATRIEDGDAAGLEQNLRAAEKALRDALERGASDQELRKLMDQLRAALDKFMRELARQAQTQPGATVPPGARQLSEQDLDRMLQHLEDLARSGDRAAAQQLLSQLQQMMDNLQMGRQMDAQSRAMQQMLSQLQDMIRRQNQLRDQTFREQQQGKEGQQGQKGESERMSQLEQQQGDLRRQLEELMRQLGQQGAQGNQALGEAGRAMGEAQGQLGKGQAGAAAGAQGRALDALRRGVQGLAEEMMAGRGRGRGGDPRGLTGISRGDSNAESTDPLGRSRLSRRPDPGNSVRVPGDIDAQRARRILEELHRRLGDAERPKDELDYLERLLP